MSDPTLGFVPDFDELAREMDKPTVLFEGRMVPGRVKNGAFIADDPEVRRRMYEEARTRAKEGVNGDFTS